MWRLVHSLSSVYIYIYIYIYIYPMPSANTCHRASWKLHDTEKQMCVTSQAILRLGSAFGQHVPEKERSSKVHPKPSQISQKNVRGGTRGHPREHKSGPKARKNHSKCYPRAARGHLGAHRAPHWEKDAKTAVISPRQGPLNWDIFTEKNENCDFWMFYWETCVQHPFYEENNRKNVAQGPRKCR